MEEREPELLQQLSDGPGRRVDSPDGRCAGDACPRAPSIAPISDLEAHAGARVVARVFFSARPEDLKLRRHNPEYAQASPTLHNCRGCSMQVACCLHIYKDWPTVREECERSSGNSGEAITLQSSGVCSPSPG